jgi:hypothetical protein
MRLAQPASHNDVVDKIALTHRCASRNVIRDDARVATDENFPGSAQTQVIGINDEGDTDGFYITAGVTQGFLLIGGVFSTVDFPGTTFNQLPGLNNRHQAAGYFADAGGIDRPYIFAIDGGVFSEIFIPAAATNGAQATGINDRGVISGFFIDSPTLIMVSSLIKGR